MCSYINNFSQVLSYRHIHGNSRTPAAWITSSWISKVNIFIICGWFQIMPLLLPSPSVCQDSLGMCTRLIVPSHCMYQGSSFPAIEQTPDNTSEGKRSRGKILDITNWRDSLRWRLGHGTPRVQATWRSHCQARWPPFAPDFVLGSIHTRHVRYARYPSTWKVSFLITLIFAAKNFKLMR